MVKEMNVRKKDLISVGLEDLPGEVWDEVPGYNGNYLISQYSRVKSLIKRNPRILRQSFSSGKYKVVLIGKYGRLISEDIGRLCARVHNRPPAENEVIEYKDGDKLNNRADNLRWISRKESRERTLIRCRTSNIRINAGEANGRAKINGAIAQSIREDKRNKMTYGQIAKKYNISIGIAKRVVLNKTWNLN
ncbi:MAG: NUMOD4 motif-containing HNH endonuclease [Dysgonomonas mossii]|uniref:NUMOD4 domain-containing protein n=1 Tax=Dysgonomonas mossii TaxID=163665 RepID=UPI001DA67B09|nr:NUMOD4 domain-containing protein [Dysgonomonas mossii]MBS7112631.1 NUMOD4 motif-containing HNH endonuclease [Dysgonomonas mossii]